jgi:hypothetical protein
MRPLPDTVKFTYHYTGQAEDGYPHVTDEYYLAPCGHRYGVHYQADTPGFRDPVDNHNRPCPECGRTIGFVDTSHENIVQPPKLADPKSMIDRAYILTNGGWRETPEALGEERG